MKINLKNNNISIYTLLWLSIIIHQHICEAIDCYKCVSLNWENKPCDDTFHTNHSTSVLESPCMGSRKGRNGLFPATACIKLTGVYDDNGNHLTVRGCALDSGTQTTDTEIIRMSHCGGFFFDDRYVRGCLHSCDNADGCNQSSIPSDNAILIVISAIISGYYAMK